MRNFCELLLSVFVLQPLLLNGELMYDYLAFFGRDSNTCTEYVFDYSGLSFSSLANRCSLYHSGNILKLGTVDEWESIKEAFDYYGVDFLSNFYLGIKMVPNGNKETDLTYDDGTPFNRTKYGMMFYEDYYSLPTIISPIQTVYHYEGNSIIRGDNGTLSYGLICTRSYNNSGFSHYVINPIITSGTLLNWESRKYFVSKVECAIICALYNTDGDVCRGYDYDDSLEVCITNLVIYYTVLDPKPIITGYYDQADPCD